MKNGRWNKRMIRRENEETSRAGERKKGERE
jgi:hypothetical protein